MRQSSWILALAASVPSWAAAADSAPLANSVPPDAVLYAGWVGAEGFGPAFARTDLGRALASADTKEAVATFFAELPKMFAYAKGAPDPAAGAVFVRVLRDRPGAVFLRRNANEAGFLAEVPAADRAAFLAVSEAMVLNGLRPKGKPALRTNGGVQYRRVGTDAWGCSYGYVGDRFFSTWGSDWAPVLIAAHSGRSLGTDPAFLAAVAGLGLKQPVAFVHVNVAAAMKAGAAGGHDHREPKPGIKTEPKKADDAKKGDDEPVEKVVEKVEKAPRSVRRSDEKWFADNFGNASRLTIGVDFEGGNCRTMMRLDGGKLSAVPAPALARDLLKLVPSDAEYFFASTLPLHSLVDKFIAHPESGSEFLGRTGFAETVRKKMDADLTKELFPHLGSTVLYNSPGGGGKWFFGYASVTEVRNEAAVAKVQAKFAALVRKVAAEVPKPDPNRFDRPSTVRLGELREGPYTIYSLVAAGGWGSQRASVPSWCLTERYLICGLYPQAVRAAVRRLAVDPDAGSVLDSPVLGPALKNVPAGSVAVSAVDTRKAFTSMTGVLTWFGVFAANELGRNEGVSTPVGAIPGLDLFVPHFGPTVSHWTADAGGLRYEVLGPLPLPAELAPAIAAALVGNMLPDEGIRRLFGLPNRWETFEAAVEAVPAVPEKAVPEKAVPEKDELKLELKVESKKDDKDQKK